jgi:hypothetical protein
MLAVGEPPAATLDAVGVPNTGCGHLTRQSHQPECQGQGHGLPDVPDPLIDTVGLDPVDRDETVGVPNAGSFLHALDALRQAQTDQRKGCRTLQTR